MQLLAVLLLGPKGWAWVLLPQQPDLLLALHLALLVLLPLQLVPETEVVLPAP